MNAPPQTGTEAIAAVATSAASVSDVAAGCLEKVRELDGAIGAFRVIDGDAVRSRAKELDDRVAGPLQGLVVGVKDVIDTADLPTAYGSPLFSDHRPSADADVVAALRRAGALVLGKTESTEFALFHPTRTRNPVDGSRTPGGSSSGSAAAVAAGMVPSATGTMPAATAAAEPLEEPPGVRLPSTGLRVRVGWNRANSVDSVLPRTSAPARRSAATTSASADGR